MQRIAVEKVSENMAEAAIGTWHVKEGDEIRCGDAVVELITEKATFEIEAEQDGILLKQYASEKSILPVGFTVCVIGSKDEVIPPEIEERNEELLQQSEISLPRSRAEIPPSRSKVIIRATPAARRRARKDNINLAQVQKHLNIGSVISENDIERYISAKGRE